MNKSTHKQNLQKEPFAFLQPTVSGWSFLVRVLIILNVIGGIGAALLLLSDKAQYPITADGCKYCSIEIEPEARRSHFKV